MTRPPPALSLRANIPDRGEAISSGIASATIGSLPRNDPYKGSRVIPHVAPWPRGVGGLAALLAASILAAALAPLPAGGAEGQKAKKKKKDLLAVFKFDAPRWQVSLDGSYARFVDYDNLLRQGGGVGVGGLFRLTRFLSIAARADWFVFDKAEKPPEEYEERGRTQVVRLGALLRYDLDIIPVKIFMAAGASLYVFAAGNLHALDPLNWGPDVQAGVDWELHRKALVGFLFQYGWILKYAPPAGKDYPTFMQVAVKVGYTP